MEEIRKEAKRHYPDLIFYTEGMALLRQSTTSFATTTIFIGYTRIIACPGRTGNVDDVLEPGIGKYAELDDLAQWLEEQRTTVPPGLTIVHQTDSHDSHEWAAFWQGQFHRKLSDLVCTGYTRRWLCSWTAALCLFTARSSQRGLLCPAVANEGSAVVLARKMQLYGCLDERYESVLRGLDERERMASLSAIWRIGRRSGGRLFSGIGYRLEARGSDPQLLDLAGDGKLSVQPRRPHRLFMAPCGVLVLSNTIE
ncbi:hypothetical protein D3H35_10000 [Cohnella faecalis]|uniref:Uncharacterized protein n=1 Tax=Cohnella faecalis TaxID=2315694 RepID=A0A398CNH4_9BACL|nr:hypothetical protein D3H35_10000 [Cohnella faecalis]